MRTAIICLSIVADTITLEEKSPSTHSAVQTLPGGQLGCPPYSNTPLPAPSSRFPSLMLAINTCSLIVVLSLYEVSLYFFVSVDSILHLYPHTHSCINVRRDQECNCRWCECLLSYSNTRLGLRVQGQRKPWALHTRSIRQGPSIHRLHSLPQRLKIYLSISHQGASSPRQLP